LLPGHADTRIDHREVQHDAFFVRISGLGLPDADGDVTLLGKLDGVIG